VTPTERHVLDRSRPMLDGEPLDRRSAAWHRWARSEHLRRFPDVDAGTRRNLDQFVARAEGEEGQA
jgi:hypothetical protein